MRPDRPNSSAVPKGGVGKEVNMMARSVCYCAAFLVLTLGAGCNRSASEVVVTDSASSERQAPSVTPVDPRIPPPAAAPTEVVRAFLEASRGGEDDLATELLSQKARDATTREGLALDPPGKPSMAYRIGDVEYPAEDRQAAYVNSVWREEQDESSERFEVVWILRQQPEGWRIAGMASRTEGESQPTLLNFEDPQDLLRIKDEVSGEPGSNPITPASDVVSELPPPPAAAVDRRR